MGVHEVPAELRGSDMAEQRLQWLRARVAAAKAEREEAERAEQADFAAQLAALGLGPVEKAPSVIGEEP